MLPGCFSGRKKKKKKKWRTLHIRNRMHILPVVLDRKSTRCQQDDIFGICQSNAWHGFPLPPLFQVCSSQQCLCGAKCLVKHLTSMMYNHATPPLFLLLLVRVFQKKCMCYSDCSAVCLWTGETKKKKKTFEATKRGEHYLSTNLVSVEVSVFTR